jgi:3-oxoacyl-[acyl-carrier-protein] synthase II
LDVESFWQAMLEQRNGVQVRQPLQTADWPIKLFAPVIGFDGKDWIQPRKAIKLMCEPIQFGYAAAMMAMQQAGLPAGGVDPDRLGTVFGSDTFFADPLEVTGVFNRCIEDGRYVHDRWGESAMKEIQPLWMLKYLPNMVASHISIGADARGPSNSICQESVSGTLAIIEGAELIRRNSCDAVIVGGTGSQRSISLALFRGQERLSRRVDRPDLACRPFDADRDGTVFGEGAGAMVLESESNAKLRGAPILAELVQWSRGFGDVKKKESFSRSMVDNLREVIVRPGFSLSEISHINAQGNSEVDSDYWEADAIREVLYDVPVWPVKSYFGDLGPGSAVIESIASLVSLREQIIPATRNYQTPDPRCPVNVVAKTLDSKKELVLKISFSRTGQIACLLFRNRPGTER